MAHYITGNTYPVRDRLKALGCRWDAGRKAWATDDASIAERAQQLVTGGRSPTPAAPAKPAAPKSAGPVIPTDAVTAAAQFGRVAVSGAKVVGLATYGLDRGDDGHADGTIRVVKGRRFVQVARTARVYLSAAALEDMGVYGRRPGGSYEWWGVEVEPTAEESAAAVAASSASDRAKVRAEIVRRVKTRENHSYTCDRTGLRALPGYGEIRPAGSEQLLTDGTRLVWVESSYSDGGNYWITTDAELAAEAARLAQ